MSKPLPANGARRSADIGINERPSIRTATACVQPMAIRAAVYVGISTRSVDDLVKAMGRRDRKVPSVLQEQMEGPGGMSGVSKSQVFRLCGEIDDKIATHVGETHPARRRTPTVKDADISPRPPT